MKVKGTGVIILTNIVLVIFVLLFFEIGLYAFSGEDIQPWRILRFCETAQRENYRFIDKSIYRNDSDGIYRFDPDSNLTTTRESAFNKSGFTGNDLVPVESDLKKILFIGDSHTFGINARPIEKNSFVSLTGDSGYFTYNSGIGGHDVVQYSLVANKYIPLLKPDYVALMLYPGNDIDRPPSPVAPGKHLHFQTNFSGWILGYDNHGNSFESASAAADHWLILQCGTSLDPAFRTLLKSQLFRRLHRFYSERIKHPSGEVPGEKNNEWIAERILKIAELAEQAGSEFILFIIPDKKRMLKDEIEHDIRFLRKKGLTPVYPSNLTSSDYQAKGGHMVNSGHKKYAEFILDQLLTRQDKHE